MIKFGNFIVTDNNSWLSESSSPGPTPVLPAGTVRVRTSDGNAPIKVEHTTYETATLVAGTTDVYDVYKSGTSFRSLLEGSTNVIEVLDSNATGITSMAFMFDDCSSLTSVSLSNTSSVTGMSQMFRDCSSLTSVSLFDTSAVNDMSQMFYSCNYLTAVPLFNTANVTNMSGMFDDCSRLTTVPLFNTSNVTNMNAMFRSCLYGLTNVPLFDTSSVTDMANMFYSCLYLTNIPLFNTSSVTNMSGMFMNCGAVESGALALYQQASTQTTPPSSHTWTFRHCGESTQTGAAELAQIPEDWGGTYIPVDPYNPLGLPPFTIRVKFKSGYTPTIGDSQTLVDAQDNIWDITKNSTDWWALFNGTQNYLLEVLGANTTGVTNMKKMFYNSKLLTTVALFDTTSVTDMSQMFYSCQVLTAVPLFDTHNVSNMGAMFDTCLTLTYVPLFDTSSVTDMHQMFNDCQTLTTVPLFNTSNVTTMSYMFNRCINVESGALALYQQASTQATPPSSHGYTFSDCGSNTTTGSAELAQIPSDWK